MFSTEKTYSMTVRVLLACFIQDVTFPSAAPTLFSLSITFKYHIAFKNCIYYKFMIILIRTVTYI